MPLFVNAAQELPDYVEREGLKWLDGIPKEPFKKARIENVGVRFESQLSKRKQRRRDFAVLQRLYLKDRARAANSVLTGEWQGQKSESMLRPKAMFKSWGDFDKGECERRAVRQRTVSD